MVSAADLSSGKLVFRPAANANGTPYTSFKFSIQDNGGTANGGLDTSTNEATQTINVRSVNDAPHAVDSTLTTDVDTVQACARAVFNFSDLSDSPGNGLAAVIVTSLPGNGSLRYNGTALTALDLPKTGSAPDRTPVTPAFRTPANASSTTYSSFKFSIQDNGGTANGGLDTSTNESTQTINVRSVNAAPTAVDSSVTTNEDTDHVSLSLHVALPILSDSPGNGLAAVIVTSLPGNGSLRYNGTALTALDLP